MKAFINPLTNILYSSFYIQGLEEILGKKNVIFSSKYFCSVPKSIVGKNLLLILEDGLDITKVFIDTDDSFKIKPEVYEWCDKYAHVNANFNNTEKCYHGKLVSLCPSFGVKCWEPIQTMLHASQNMISAGVPEMKKMAGKYKRLLDRCTLDEYTEKTDVIDNYIFFCSTLWYNDEWNKNDEGVNLTRARFIRACKKIPSVRFEGGMVSQGTGRSSEALFADCLMEGVSMKEWLRKTKESALVFNTPAFWDCHGWKLGEYLAMGKAIISTKLSNDLPEPLVHGVNIHYVDNDERSMEEAVKYIVSHPDYRKTLEIGAREYWGKYGTPEASLRLLGISKQ